jgi:hypothetical protein
MRLPKAHLQYSTTAQAIITAIDGNTNFPNSAPLVATAKTALAAYLKAIADRAAKLPNAVKARNEARGVLQQAMEHLRDNVQSAVDANVEMAASTAESAKMSLRKVPVRNKDPFQVKDGKVSGQVLLIAKAILGALTYFWEFSVDSKSWSSIPETSKASTTYSGLTPGQLYYFRFRAHTRKGMTDYQVVSFMVR